MVIKILADSKPGKYVAPSGAITFVFVCIGIITLLPQVSMTIAGLVKNLKEDFFSNIYISYVAWTIAILYQAYLLVLEARFSAKINRLQHTLIDTQRWAWDVNERIEAIETPGDVENGTQS